MTSIFDKLNLRRGERRLVIVVGVVVFVVLNVWLVFPLFGKRGSIVKEAAADQQTLTKFREELAMRTTYERLLRTLQEQGNYVPSADQANRLIGDLQSEATANRVFPQGFQPGRDSTVRTNSFFEEKSVVVTFNNTGEKELVDFLYFVGQRGSRARVRSLQLWRDQGDTKLRGSITFVGSFQKTASPSLAAAAPVAQKPPAAPAKAPPAEPRKTGPGPVNAKPAGPPPVARPATSAPPVAPKTPAPPAPKSTNSNWLKRLFSFVPTEIAI